MELHSLQKAQAGAPRGEDITTFCCAPASCAQVLNGQRGEIVGPTLRSFQMVDLGDVIRLACSFFQVSTTSSSDTVPLA